VCSRARGAPPPSVALLLRGRGAHSGRAATPTALWWRGRVLVRHESVGQQRLARRRVHEGIRPRAPPLRIGDCRDGCTLPAEPTHLARPGGPEAVTVASVSLCAARSIFFTTEHHHTSTWTRMSDAER
jgi:hypothetical protein